MKKLFISILLLISIFPVSAQEILTLLQCRELALKNNAKAKNAELVIEQAREQKKEAFTHYFPQISLTGAGFLSNKPMMSMEMDVGAMLKPMISDITPVLGWALQQTLFDFLSLVGGDIKPVKIDALKNGIVGGVMATQPIFAGGQIVNGNRLAKTAVEIRQLQKEMTDNEVLLTTENYFWQIVSLKEKIKTLENAEKMLDRILSDVTIAVETGLTSRNDLTRVELERNRLAGYHLKAENGLKTLKLVFAQHIGVPAYSFDILPPPFNEIPLSPKNVDADLALPNRPEYKLLERSVDIAKIQVDMEIGKNLPTVAIGAGYQYMNFDLHTDNGMKNNFGMAFATVSVPITNWWAGTHAIKQKKLEHQMAENTRNENTDLLLVQMQQVRNELNEAYFQIMLSKKSISVAEENLRMSNDHYNAGITTLTDLLEAQNLLQQSRDQYTEALTEYYKKLAEYKQINISDE